LRYAVNSELAEADLANIWVEIATDDIDTADRFIQGLRTLAHKLAGRDQVNQFIGFARWHDDRSSDRTAF
jgi:plasmid stabilization system protein ParE